MPLGSATTTAAMDKIFSCISLITSDIGLVDKETVLASGRLNCSRNILGFLLQFDCQFFYTILELIDLLSSVVFVQYFLT